MKTKDMAYIALMAVLISVCSWLSVPAAIPFTMQTFAVFTALLLLGGRRGSIAVAVYIALGAVGLPVFSGFAGGVGKLIGSISGALIIGIASTVFEVGSTASIAKAAVLFLVILFLQKKPQGLFALRSRSLD